jgi:excisionase family DNA binding protein
MKNEINIGLSDEMVQTLINAVKEGIKKELPDHLDHFRREWLSTDEVMDMLHVSRRTVQNYRNENKIPYVQLNRKILYPREGIEAFLQEHLVPAANQNITATDAKSTEARNDT